MRAVSPAEIYDSGKLQKIISRLVRSGYSNAKMRFQSLFMLITVQRFLFASS